MGNRPFHADESVHAAKFRLLWETGAYRYDPDEFHGPAPYYAALPVVALRHRPDFARTTEADYRLAPALVGAALVLLLLLLGDGLGRPAAGGAALLLAVSPAWVFYSRYFIPEIFLVAATLLVLAAGWRYRCRPGWGWAVAAGVGAGGMLASKETAVLSFAAAGLALALTRPPDLRRTRGGHLAAACLVALAVAALFVTGGGHNPVAVADYVRSYTPWATRAGTDGLHRHPWFYYLSLLAGSHGYTEALVVALALAGAVAAMVPRLLAPGISPRLARFLLWYTLMLGAAYSVIPYKTPWCVLNPLLPAVLLAGVGAASGWHAIRPRVGKAGFGVCLLAVFLPLTYAGYRVAFLSFADAHNPYAYAPTSPEAQGLTARIAAFQRAAPAAAPPFTVAVIAADSYYWPLPWYLRAVPQTGYWVGQVPATPDLTRLPVVLAAPQFDDALAARLDKTHLMTGFVALRPGTLFEVWVRDDIWAAYLHKRGATPENPAE